MTRYAIGLGSNMGDRLAFLRAGVHGLKELGDVGDVSGLYETAPIGGPEQDPYLNAVALVGSDLGPRQLLAELNRIEAEQKRERRERWGARTLDLDIIAIDEPWVDTPDLQIPHPRASEREFVLRPLVEVWPEAFVSDDLPAQAALDASDDQGVDRLARVWIEPFPVWKGRVFVGVQVGWLVVIALALAWDGTLPDGSADVFRGIGGLLAVFGGALAFVSSRRLGAALVVVPEPTDEGVLVETGPYGMVRHPIYGGVTLFILGTSMILNSVTGALLSLGLLLFFFFKSEYEERLLRIQYSNYLAYQGVVTRRFVPFVL